MNCKVVNGVELGAVYLAGVTIGILIVVYHHENIQVLMGSRKRKWGQKN